MHNPADRIRRRPHVEFGFTLVELLVVIGIIGMLVAMLLPAVMSGQEQARQTLCSNQMKNLAGAHLHHATKKGRFAGWWSGIHRHRATVGCPDYAISRYAAAVP